MPRVRCALAMTGIFARGAVRPRNDRDFCKGCGARQAGDREGRPYESVTRGAVGRAGAAAPTVGRPV